MDKRASSNKPGPQMVTSSFNSGGGGRKQPQRSRASSGHVHGTLSPARLTRVCRWIVDVERSRDQRERQEKSTDSRASKFRGAGETLAVSAALTHRQFTARASPMHVPTDRGATTIMQRCLEFLPPSNVLITGGNRVDGSHEAKAPSVRGRGADLLSSAQANAVSGVMGRRAQTVRAKPGEVKREGHGHRGLLRTRDNGLGLLRPCLAQHITTTPPWV